MNDIIEGQKLPIDVKQEIQDRSIQNQQVPTESKNEVQSEMIDVLNKVSPQMMERAQEEDFDISQVMHYVKAGKKPTFA